MRLNNSLKAAVYILLFLCAAVMLLKEIGDNPDIWLHLKTGQYIAQNHKIPSYDIFSYTVTGNRWINHEWLYQIIIFYIYQLLGLNGIIFFRALIFLAICLIIYRLSSPGSNYILTSLLILLFLSVISGRLNDRPEMFTLLFFALFILIFERYSTSKLIWIIPLLQLIWVNMHGYFLLGLVIILAYMMEAFIRRQANFHKISALLGLSVIFSLINPNFIQGFLYPFKILMEIKGRSEIFTHYITELLPPFAVKGTYGSISLFFYKTIIVIAICALLVNINRLKIANTILFIITLLISLAAIRNIPLFAFMGTCSFLINANEFYSRSTALKKIKASHKTKLGIFMGASLAIALTVVFFNTTTAKYYVFEKMGYKSRLLGVSPIKYPIGAVEFLKKEKILGNILNNFFCGSYLIWELYPEKKVFIDGRTEVYGPEFYKYFRNALENGNALKNLIAKYDINIILFSDPANQPQQVISWLLTTEQFKIIYLDDVSIISIKNSPENQKIINKYNINLREVSIIPPKQNIAVDTYPYKYLNEGKLFALAGLFDKAEESAKIALSLDKKSAEAHNLLGATYLAKGDFDSAIKILKDAVLITPNDENLHYNLGIAYYNEKDFPSAIVEYKKAIAINPMSQKAQFGLALCYERSNQMDKAKKILLNMQKKDLTGDICCELGYIYLKEQRLEMAKEAFDKALKINPIHARSHNGIGLVYAHSGLSSEAEKHFKAAIENAPNFKEAYDNLGVLYAKNGNYDSAIVEWGKALEIDPNFEPARQKLEKTKKALHIY